MSEPPPLRRRRWLRWLGYFCLLCFVALGLLFWYCTTDSFQQYVRRRVIAEIEKATGGRVEVGSFHTIPFRLRVDLRNLIIHGREEPDQIPLLQVDRMQAELRIVSLIGTRIRLHTLLVEHPVIHLIVYPDGSTNQPAPPVGDNLPKSEGEDLFSLDVSRVELERGELLWQEKRIPIELDARDVGLLLRYSFLRRHYQAQLAVGNATTRVQKYPQLAWRADAAIVLSRTRADITSLNIVSGESELHFTGRVEDFKNPKVSVDYRGALDLTELAAFLRRNELRKGTTQFQGKATWTLDDFSTQGTLTARDIEAARGNLKTQNGRVNAAFLVTPKRLRVSSIRANLFGGELQGDVDLNNWQSSFEPQKMPLGRHTIGRVATQGPQRGSVRLQLSGFSLAPGIALLSSKKVPLDRLNLAGAVSGNLEMQWIGSIRDAETRVALNIVPPAETQPHQLPVRAQVAGVYNGSHDELQLETLHANTTASELIASGNLASPSGLKVSATSHDLREVKPLLQAAYGSDNLPFAIHGWANFNGNVTGRLSALAVAGNLEVYDFETNLPVGEHREARTVHWDALTAAIQYSPSDFAAHNAVLIHGHTAARFDVNSSLVNGTPADNLPFNLRLDLRNADVAEAAQLAGFNKPIAGTADISIVATGTRSHPHGNGRLEIRDAIAYGTHIPFVHSDLRLADDEIQFDNLETSVYDSPVTGSVALIPSKYQFRLNLTGRDLNLARFPRLQTNRVTVDGAADFTVHASGTMDKPLLEAQIHVRDLALDKERAGDFYLDATTQGAQLSVRAHSEFQQGELKVDGQVGMDHDFPADLDLSFRQIDIDSLLNIYLPGRITSHSTVSGSVRLHGPLRLPDQLKVSANVSSLDAEIAHVKLKNAEPLRFEVADQIVRVESFHLSGSGTDFNAHGTAQLAGAREMDFRLDGAVGMELLQTLNSKISSRGSVGVSLSAGGTFSNPVLQGRLEVKDTFISHNDFPSGLSNLNGVLLFDQNRIQIESLNGTTGGGTIALTGAASYERGIVQMDIGATAHDVRMRYPPGVSSTSNANLRLTGSSNSALLSGDVVVTKLGVTPGFDFGAYAAKSKSIVIAGPDTLESRLRLDVHVVTTPELQMQTAIAKLSGSADLRVRGTADRPVATGRVNANEGGQLSFNGTKYNVERFEVTFANPAKTQPIIEIQASTRVRDYDITVNISGDLSVPNGLKPTWHSEPPLPEADVIALLALGRTTEESAQQGNGVGGFGGEASNLLISQALNTAVSSRVQRLFGVSRIKIDPQGLTNETNVVRGPQVTIEQQVASNVTITYSTNVSVTSQQIIQVEYNVTRSISIVALRDQNGVVSFDVKIRQRKK